MNKDQYIKELQSKLKEVPLDVRQKMNESDLMMWWNKIRQENPDFTWEKAPGDIWQSVKVFCQDLIGKNAY